MRREENITERANQMRTNLIPMVALVATGVCVCPAQQLQVTAVRFWSLTEVTRVSIQTTGEFKFKWDHVTNPDRLFFDLLGATPRVGMSETLVNDKLLKRIRVGETQPGRTRIVLDIEPPIQFTASQFTDRLMIELRPAGRVGGSPPTLLANPSTPSRNRPGLPAPDMKTEPADVGQTRDLSLRLASPRVMDPVHPATDITPAGPPTVASKTIPADGHAQAAKRASSGGSSLIRALGLKLGRVVIDPGHGGHDQGTVGASGLMEKELVLDVAKRLGALIEDRMGSEVIYTRQDDTFIPLEARTELANQQKADLFISLHANSSPAPSAAGIETYYLNLTTSPEALELASKENAGSRQAIHDLRDIIQRITLNDKAEESREFARRVQAALYSFAVRSNPAAKDRGVKKAPFIVLIGATMPSILAEIGFVSNPKEESLLKRAEYRQRLADALYRGVSRYAETLSHFQVARQ
jgi:N-acetylmuramoyl-L-alanine amidase